VAYSLKARVIGLQYPAVSRQWPLNNRGTMFSAQSMPVVVHATVEYVMPSLSYNFTTTENGVFYAAHAEML
jgi:hypothetical protein